mmetsp:Transcript_109387/g.172421  ORF Transcript_109387/g.172421 Transcript_109387/m.172421 type:complete len:482 (+) Transcript_109387:80-1525(+)
MEVDRQARREAQRIEKAKKKELREANRLRNTARCDVRAYVRIAASTALKGTLVETGSGSTSIQELEHDENEAVEAHVASFSALDLESFSLDLLPKWKGLTSLDLSHNRLSELPGVENLTSLIDLNLCRNSFRDLPFALRHLPRLSKLNASRNSLRPSTDFLILFLQAPGLPALSDLDITFNKKCFTQDLADLLAAGLPNVAVRMTVTFPSPPGAFVGNAACDRDATLLRSQLEPYTTLQLRERLVSTFGHEPYSMYGEPPEARAEVMKRLLECYANAGQERRLVRVNGTPVNPNLISDLMVLLRDWLKRNFNWQERPYIHAETYMILRSPAEFEKKLTNGSRNAQSARRKFEENKELWELAAAAMRSVDAEFAAKFTGLAITYGFKGSPHIDTTNTGPFYGLALGDFADGTGGVRVEMDPMTVAEVNTKHRLGKVDGRFPHWVAPYDERCERFSLIFYQTEGEVVPQTTAVFGDLLEDVEQ